MNVLVVRADGPAEPGEMERTLDGEHVLSWCAPGAALDEDTYDLVLLANADRSPDMVDWVAREVTRATKPGGHYQWRDKA